MAKKITVGIDVGSYETRVIIFERAPTGTLAPIAHGSALSRGVRHGYIVNQNLCSESLGKAIRQAQNESGIKIKKASVIIGGAHLSSIVSVGSAIISKADNEITERDIENAITEAEKSISLQNQKVLDVVPMQYKIDGKVIFASPVGMRGVKLEVKALFVTGDTNHIDTLMTMCADAGVDVAEVMPAVSAEHSLVSTDQQRIAGALIMNIGAESTMLGVYENGTLISLGALSLGGRDITNDIALVLKISLEEAEGIKTGTVITPVPKKKLDDIIAARLGDIFEATESYLKKIKRSELLPAGVILTGGTSYLPGIADYARSYLKIPARAAVPEILFRGEKTRARSIAWLPLYGMFAQHKKAHQYDVSGISFDGFFGKIKEFFSSFVKQLLP